MALEITLTGPPVSWLRRAPVLHVLGAALLAFGVVVTCAVIGLVFWALAAYGFADGTAPASADDRALGWACVAAAADLLCWTFGVALLRRGRHGVLYLRHFKHATGREMLSQTAGRIGGRWRFVTLDEGLITAQGVTDPMRAAARSLGSAADRLERTADVVVDRAESWTNRWSIIAFGILLIGIGGMIWAAAGAEQGRWLMGLSIVGLALWSAVGGVVSIVAAFPVLGYFVLLPAVLLTQSFRDAVAEADERKVASIADEAQLPTSGRLIQAATKRIFAPRLAVVTVADVIWRRTVLALAAEARVVLVDVSKPTRHLLWEVEHLTNAPGIRCVLVAQRDLLRALCAPDPGAASGAPASAHRETLLKLLDGQRVLAYDTSREGRRQFERALRAALASHQTITPATKSRSVGPLLTPLPSRYRYDSGPWNLESLRAVAGLAGTEGRAPRRIVDIGAGSGTLIRLLADRRPDARFLLGLDPDVDRIAAAAGLAEDPRTRFACAVAENLPLPDASVDLIVTHCSFRFWTDQVRALAECRRVLAPGGRLILADTCASSPVLRGTAALLRRRDHLRTPAEIAALLERSGLRVRRHETTLGRQAQVQRIDTFIAAPR